MIAPASAVVIAAALVVAYCGWSTAQAQDVSAARPAVLPLATEAEGAPVLSVEVHLRKPSGDETRDREAREAAWRIVAPMAGAGFSQAEARQALSELVRQDAIVAADFHLLQTATEVGVRLIFDIDAEGEGEAQPEAPERRGLLRGDASDFPILYEDDRSLLQAIVGAGIGGYADSNPWFGRPELFNRGNPLAGTLPGENTAWNEGYVELGLGGATQFGASDFYVYAALTGMFSWSRGQDIFRDDDRDFVDFEKVYAGLLYVSPERRQNNARISVGRQTYTLNDGFLVNAVKGSTNAGERGGLYLGPRLTNDFSVIAQGRWEGWRFNLFFIDPNELEALESDSTFLGANLRYDLSENIAVDASFIAIPTSNSRFANPHGLVLPREGLSTAAGHAKWVRAFNVPGLFFEGEYARQFHPDYDMSAWAYYGSAGYRANGMPWTPSLSYRYAYFSGDDPDTLRYERFDPLLSTGLGIWLQGVSFGKIVSNSNLESHRVQANAAPYERLNLTFDYYRLRAPELNNLGSNPALSTLASRDFGQEYSISARWSATKRLYLQALVSHAVPGNALRAIGAENSWTTFQVSLYSSF